MSTLPHAVVAPYLPPTGLSSARARPAGRGWERLGAVAEERRDRNRRGWGGVIKHSRPAAE